MNDYEFDHKTYEQESKDTLQVSFKETDPEEGFRLTVSILSEKYGDSKEVKSLNVSAEDFFKSFDQVTSEKFMAMANRYFVNWEGSWVTELSSYEVTELCYFLMM